MAFDRDHFERPFSKLRKAIKQTNALSDPARVHKLRTNTRRVEAILGAVDLLSSDEKKKLLRELKRVRRAAGMVRDMDVLTGKAADVDVEGEQDCRIQLLQQLGSRREKASRKLRKELLRDRAKLRSGLKHGERAAGKLLASKGGSEDAAARALDISAELRNFATMNRGNLHEFRKRAKQLRYVLQMADPADGRLLDGLRQMQDAVGEWHDWQELVAIATDALSHGRCGLIRELQLHADSSFDEALRVANRVRRELLGARRGPVPLRVVKATSAIAA